MVKTDSNPQQCNGRHTARLFLFPASQYSGSLNRRAAFYCCFVRGWWPPRWRCWSSTRTSLASSKRAFVISTDERSLGLLRFKRPYSGTREVIFRRKRLWFAFISRDRCLLFAGSCLFEKTSLTFSYSSHFFFLFWISRTIDSILWP